MTPELKVRLNSFDIGVMSEGNNFCLFVRDGCLAMVPCQFGIFGGIGSTGLALEDRLAYLVWHSEKPYLVSHDYETPAEPEQVEKIRKFTSDLQAALGIES